MRAVPTPSAGATRAAGLIPAAKGPVYWTLLILNTFAILGLLVLAAMVVYRLLARPATISEGFVARNVASDVVFQGERVAVDLTLQTASLSPCSGATSAGSRSIVLLLDRSGSLSGPGLARSRQAAQALLADLDFAPGRDQAALIAFAEEPTILVPFSSDAGPLEHALAGLTAAGSADLAAGVAAAEQLLREVADPGERIIVLFSDDQLDRELVEELAGRLEAAGIKLVSFGLGAATVGAPAAGSVIGDVMLIETFDNQHFRHPEEAASSGTLTQGYTWLTQAGASLRYAVVPEVPGRWHLSPGGDGLRYTMCDGRGVVAALPVGPRVTVLPSPGWMLLPLLAALLAHSANWLWRRYFWTPELHLRVVRPLPTTQPPPALAAEGQRSNWNPPSALIIGLGGAGRQILEEAKLVVDDGALGQGRPQVRFLAIDARQNGEPEALGQDRSSKPMLEPDEVLNLAAGLDELIKTVSCARHNELPHLQGWFPAADYDQRLPRGPRDQRAGTGGRRPAGRALVFEDLKGGLAASRLWARLTERINAVRAAAGGQSNGQQIRLIVVASLAGGFGSGVLVDVVYLARAACCWAGFAKDSIEVSLVTIGSTPYATLPTTPGGGLIPRLNTRAALRELERFLLNRRRHFPVAYAERERIAEGDRDILASSLHNLIDDWWLLDEPRKQRQATQPGPGLESELYPMVADALLLLLDGSAKSGANSLASQRRIAGSTSQRLQVETGQGFVGSFGAFTFRLPMRKLVTQLQARFAYELLQLFVTGQHETSSGARPLEPDARAIRGYAERLARAASAPLALRLLGAIQQRADGAKLTPAVADLAVRSLREGAGTYVEIEAADFSMYLQGAILKLLDSDSEENPAARAGTLSFAIAVLDELHQLIVTSSRIADWHRRVAPPRRGRVAAALLPKLAMHYAAVVEAQRSHLQEQAELLGPWLTVASANRRHSVAQELQVRGEAALHSLDATPGQGVVRQYLLMAENEREHAARTTLLDAWYRRYCAPHLVDALNMLTWQIDAASASPRVCVSDSHQGVMLETTSLDALADSLLAVAAWATRTIWQSEHTATLVAEALERVVGDDARLSKLYAQSEPALTYLPTGASRHVQDIRYFWSPGDLAVASWQSVREQFGRRLAEFSQGTNTLLDATDPYACTLITLRDHVPIRAIKLFATIDAEYQSYYGISVRGRAGDRAAFFVGEPTAVWAAERHAREIFEVAIERVLEQPGRLLSPHFVGALEHLERAKLFLLAYAAGLVQVSDERSLGAPACRLTLTEGSLNLLDTGATEGLVALEVLAMHNFVLGSDDVALLAQPLWGTREQLLRAALKQLPPAERAARWQHFEQRAIRELPAELPLGRADLVLCARVLVRRMFQAKPASPPSRT